MNAERPDLRERETGCGQQECQVKLVWRKESFKHDCLVINRTQLRKLNFRYWRVSKGLCDLICCYVAVFGADFWNDTRRPHPVCTWCNCPSAEAMTVYALIGTRKSLTFNTPIQLARLVAGAHFAFVKSSKRKRFLGIREFLGRRTKMLMVCG